MERVYLDHAATSWPKPPGVLEALVDFQSSVGAAGGRGVYAAAQTSNSIVASVRTKLARLIGAASPKNIALTHNGTASLNLALSGLLKPGDHVVTTAAEHNSVLRPLRFLQRDRAIEVTVVPVDADGLVSSTDVEQAVRRETRMVVMTHASNVTGRIQPLDKVAEVTKHAGVLLLLDAAQTLGYIPIDVGGLSIDLLAAPGHKGACGLLGTGLLYASDAIKEQIQTPWPGGTGTDSENLDGPFGWPDGVEAGNLNVPALAGWTAGLDWLAAVSIEERRRQAARLRCRLHSILLDASFGRVVGDHADDDYVPVVSVVTDQLPCADLAAIFDSSFKIEVRSGLHCAGMIHAYLGTRQHGGTIRFSLGHTSSERDLDSLEQACRELSRAFQIECGGQ